MDLTSNDLFYLIKKKIIDKIDKDKKPSLPSITKRIELLKNNKKEESTQIYFKGIILNASNISNFIYNSVNPKIHICFNNLEYLSITNNFLINLNFIINLPDLFYLDVYGNPLDEFYSLNYKNIFGYLRLSVDKFHENKILAVSGLNCAILDFDIKDKTILKAFKSNNKNILMYNNEINYYIDKIASKKKKTFKTKKTIKFVKLNNDKIIDNKNNNEKNNIDSNNILNKNKYLSLNFNDLIKKIEEEEKDYSKNNSDNSEKSIIELNKKEDYDILLNNNLMKKNNIKIEIKNDFLLKIKNFFEELEQVIIKLRKKIKTKININHLSNDDNYLNIEKKRLLLLYQTYLKLSIFNNEKNTDFFFCKNINSINNNKFTDEIKIYEIKQYIKCININIRFGIIILITILFYCLNMISIKLSISIIHYLLLNHYKFDEHKHIPKFENFGQFHYLCFYYDNLEDFKKKLKFAEKSQIDLYQKILNILEIKELILKSNYLKQKKDEKENNNKILIEKTSQKNKVSSLLMLMKELKIDKKVFILIEFFCDFIIFENMEHIVINEALNDEYSTLIEIKEKLELIELDKNDLNKNNLSNKKFYKNKLERIFNKFYFENDKIKVVKNKNFQNLEDNKIIKNSLKYNLLSFINNWNKDYMKKDQISIKNCFSIDKLIKKDNKKQKYINKYKEQDFTQNICFSEDKRNIKNSNQTNYNNNYSIVLDKKNSFNSHRNYTYKDEINTNKKFLYKTNYNLNNKNNSYFTFNSEKNKNLFGIKSTNDIYNSNKNSKNNKLNIFNIKDNNFKDIFKYFDNGYKNKNLKKLKNINYKKFLKKHLLNENVNGDVKNFKNKKDKYYFTLNNNNNNEGSFPFNTISKEDAKLKIKQIDNDIVNLNAHRLFWKNKSKNSRENINLCKENYSEGLFVEKYNQEKQAKIINEIIENKNRKLKEKLSINKKYE